mgnify:CR=1 FL=1
MDNNQIGCLAEYKFATVAMELGFYVSFPLLNTSRYDCIIETSKGLFKIQVKSVQKNRDRSRVFIRDTKNNNYKKKDVDFFAFVALPIRAVFFAVTHDVTSSVFRIRKEALDVVVEQESLEKVIKNLHG